ncbi:hypothetical protein [Streptomyces exfoliatus]|uniref:hypothetical protein n=1 Tax=Streptomyces exfoliatus TaxID=1905 RepID=UPI0037A1524A
MAEANVVGRIAVKVMPDTNGFKGDLKRELERIERGLGVEVGITANAKEVVEEAKEARRRAQHELRDLKLKVDLEDPASLQQTLAQLKGQLKALNSQPVTISADAQSLNQAISDFENRLRQVRTVSIRVDNESASSVGNAIKRIDQELAKLKEVELKVGLNEADLEKERARLERVMRKTAKMSLSVDMGNTSSVASAISRIDAELAKRREVQLGVKMDDASLKRARADLEEKLRLDLSVDKTSMSSVDAALSQVEAQLAAMNESELRVKLDAGSLSRAKADLMAAKARIQADLDDAARFRLSVDKDSAASVRAAIDALKAEIAKDAEVEIVVKTDAASLKAAQRTLEARLKKVARLRLEVDRKSNASVQKAIDKIDAELEKRKAGKLKVDVELKSDALRRQRGDLERMLTLDLKIDRTSTDSVERALSQVRAQLAAMNETEIKVKLDRSSLESERARLEAALGQRLRVKIAADQAAAQVARNEIQSRLDAIKVRPKLDTQVVAQTKRQLESAFEQMRDLRARITPELDAMERARVEREIADLQDKIKRLRSEIEPEVSRSALAVAVGHLAALARTRVVNLVPKVSLSAAATAGAMLQALSGARVLGQVFEKLGNTIRNLDKSAPIIGTLASAIAGLSAWGIAAASNLFALSASLAQIGAIALALPGLLGGIAIGLGATIAAFKDFNKVLPEVKGQFSALQDTISGNFWAEAKAPIRELIDTLLPELSAGFGKTSTQLGSFFGGFSASLKSALAPALSGMFDDLSKSIDIAAGGTNYFANIIKTLGEVGAGYLPQLAQWFVDVAGKASAWLDKKGESGLRKEIDEGIGALKNLGGILAETGGIFAGISNAATAAGGSTLLAMRNTLAGIHEAVDSSGVQAKLVGLFTAAHDAMSSMASTGGAEVRSFFGQFVGLLTQIMPQVGTILGTAMGGIAAALNQGEVFAGVYALFNGFQSAVTSLAPALAPLGQALGSLLTLAGSFLTMLGPLVASVLTPLSQAFTMLTPAIEPLIGLLGGALTGVFAQLTPIVMQLVPVIGEALNVAFAMLAAILPPIAALFTTIMTAVMPLVASLMEGLAPVLPLVATAFSAIVTAVTPVVSLLMQLFSAVITPLIPLFEYIVSACLPPLVEAFNRVSTALQPFLQALIQVVNFIMPILVPALQFVADFIIGALAMALDGIVDVITGVLDVIMGVWEVFAGIFTGDWSRAWEGIKQIFSGIWNILVGVFKVVINIGIFGVLKKGMALVKGIWESGWSGIKGFFTGIWNAIKGWLSVAWAGIRGLLDDGVRAVSSMWSRGWNAVKQFFIDAWNAIKTKAVEGAKALWQAIEDGVKQAIKFVKELPGKAKDALSDIGSALLDAGKKLIKGLIKGITSMFGGVKESLGNLTDKLADWKGPAKKDALLLYDAGRLIIQGLIKGLESQFDKVKKALNELTAKIPKGVSKALRDRINKDRTQLLKLAAEWDAGAKRLEAARDKLDKIREETADYGRQIRERIIDTGDVTKVKDPTFETITGSLKNAVEEAKRFAAVLAKLKTLGLNQTTFDQIAMAGPEAGLASAEAITKAGASGVAELNQLQKELEKYATASGSTASHYMYDAGIRAAEGLVKGLEAKQDEIEKQMLKIADSMVKAIKKALDIHSPSRLFRKLGSFVGQGFSLGVTDERGRVERATNALATSAASGASRGVTAAVSGGLSSTGPGRSVTKVLNYYAGNGSSLSSEEELFAAASRARMVGW